MNRSLRHATSLAVAALVTLAVAACPKPAPPAPPEPVRVENRALGLSLVVPDAFEVAANEGRTLRLLGTAAAGGGAIEIAVDDSRSSINVVEEARSAQAEIEAKPEAKFSGGNELVTPAGSAYAVRGSWTENGARVEERRILALHPDGGGRLLTLVDRYPAGDTTVARDRFGRLLELLSALEAGAP